MKRLLVLFVVLFTLMFSYTVVAQEMGAMKKGISINFPEKIHKLVLDPLPAGTYSIGSGGYFPTIDSAFNKLSIDGISGEVILELIDNLYTAPTTQYGFSLDGPIPGAGPNSRVTIKPAANKNVTIKGNSYSVLYFMNTSYVTIDGVALTGSTTLTIHAFHNAAYPCNDAIDFLNNSDHDVIQNISSIVEDYTRPSGFGFFCWSGSSQAPDSNLIQNNFVKQGGITLFISSNGALATGKDNIVRGNQIGSESDSLIAWGIQIEVCQNTLIENNVVQNLRPTNITERVNPGINSYSGSGDIIRNNIVHNIKPSIGYSSVGILLSGGSGSNNSIYNNMVYDISSTSPQSDSRVAGIQIWLQNSPKIYYNTVYLSGNGANHQGSGAFYIYGGWGNSTNVELKNNIFVNTRNESPYCASSINDYTASNLTSDYNDLFYDDTNPNNCLVRAGNDFHTLADWQATGKDINSITEMPNFISPYLHITENEETLLESRGIPIAGIDVDFDGQTRQSATPDIGADEFDGIAVGVDDEGTLPTEYALEQNYPNPFNPTTTFRYSIPTQSKVVIKVYDILGNEVATLMDEEKSVGTYELTWNAENLPSGIYFYQLNAGSFIETKKMLLLK
jgi:hypothetical protein